MAEPKPFASLSSGLLARKGAAKPAMRPQGFGQMGMSMEDLGWNDMGHAPQSQPAAPEELPEHVPSSIAALTPSPRLQTEMAPAPVHQPAPPRVVEQQRAIETTFAEKPKAPPAPKAVRAVVPAPVPQASSVKGGKAAFTLRLDPERHLKLRLACALSNRSAQQMVTEALDDLLAAMPELDGLTNQLPAKSRRN